MIEANDVIAAVRVTDSVYCCGNDAAGSQDRERYRSGRLGDSSGALGGRERRATEFAERGGGVSLRSDEWPPLLAVRGHARSAHRAPRMLLRCCAL